MQTVTIDIINNKVFKLLQDLELLQLIRLRTDKPTSAPVYEWATKYKGAMSKQPIIDIDKQVRQLRNEWD
ncbi:MAG: hypothetical protein EAZ15_07075 [Sphingobacteriales bacterium]|nr:MAG: hypothetical protein EAZ15_07075 [Sphingobacteriales bacterium]